MHGVVRASASVFMSASAANAAGHLQLQCAIGAPLLLIAAITDDACRRTVMAGGL
jgi:hypothetical protein